MLLLLMLLLLLLLLLFGRFIIVIIIIITIIIVTVHFHFHAQTWQARAAAAAAEAFHQESIPALSPLTGSSLSFMSTFAHRDAVSTIIASIEDSNTDCGTVGILSSPFGVFHS